jgi:hypothetical protein
LARLWSGDHLSTASQIQAARSAKNAHLTAQLQASASGANVRSINIVGANVTIDVDDATRIDTQRLQSSLRRSLGPNVTVTIRERP